MYLIRFKNILQNDYKNSQVNNTSAFVSSAMYVRVLMGDGEGWEGWWVCGGLVCSFQGYL